MRYLLIPCTTIEEPDSRYYGEWRGFFELNLGLRTVTATTLHAARVSGLLMNTMNDPAGAEIRKRIRNYIDSHLSMYYNSYQKKRPPRYPGWIFLMAKSGGVHPDCPDYFTVPIHGPKSYSVMHVNTQQRTVHFTPAPHADQHAYPHSKLQKIAPRFLKHLPHADQYTIE